MLVVLPANQRAAWAWQALVNGMAMQGRREPRHRRRRRRLCWRASPPSRHGAVTPCLACPPCLPALPPCLPHCAAQLVSQPRRERPSVEDEGSYRSGCDVIPTCNATSLPHPHLSPYPPFSPPPSFHPSPLSRSVSVKREDEKVLGFSTVCDLRILTQRRQIIGCRETVGDDV